MKNNKVIRSKLFPDLPTKFHFFSVAEVAIILGTSTKSVHEWISQGLLKSFRIGPKSRLIRISYQNLEDFIDSHVRTGEIKLPEEDTGKKADDSSQTQQ